MPGHIDPERRRQICSMGGKAAQASGRAHRFTSEEAKEAGRKGGRALAENRAHMAEIGRKGGLTPRKPKQKSQNTQQTDATINGVPMKCDSLTGGHEAEN